MGTRRSPEAVTPAGFHALRGITACWPGAKVPAPVNSSIIQALAASPRYLAARLAEVSGVFGITTMKSGDSNTSGGGGPVTTGVGGGVAGGAVEAQPHATIATTARHSRLRHIARNPLVTSCFLALDP